MQIHDLIQGTPEWKAHRATHFNASDAPAMMGCSPYKTRSQLLHELHTGRAPEVDAATQRRFDDGHRFEALARPLAEAIIGQDLYPVTGSEGELSASFDGLTMCESIGFEHKTLNESLRACMRDEGNGYDLPMQYQIQMEQQLMVSGAERILFMASAWTGDDLVEKLHCWYASDPALRAKIVAGWKQFAADLATYVPAATEPPAIGRTPETLPALHIEVTGMVTASNLAEYKAHALAVFGNINRELKTDQDFASAESTVKWCADIEQRLAAAKQHALSQTESIDALFRTIDDISAEARRVRLELDKLVKARKEAVKGEVVAGGVAALAKHIRELNAAMPDNYMPTIPADFGGCIKGLRTVDSIRNAVDTELARAKIAASEIANRIHANVKTIEAANRLDLFVDRAALVLKAPDDLAAIIAQRVAAAQARIEAERERIRTEEVARLAAEQAERDRVAAEKAGAEAIARAQTEAATEVKPAQPAVCEIVQTDPAPAMFLHGNLPVTQAQFDKTYPVKQKAPATPPTMALGEISAKLGFNVTSAFLATLGFEATTVKAAKLFHEKDFPAICRALIEHIESVCEMQAA